MLAILRFWFRLGSLLAPDLVARHGARLFMTSARHGMLHAEAAAFLAAANRFDREYPFGRVAVYRWPSSQIDAPRVLIAHGWSDNAANLLPLIRLVHELGYDVYALDWPAHGNSTGSQTNMREWLLAARDISAQFGPWHAVIGHSLGAFCLAAATWQDVPQFGLALQTERMVLIAPPENSLDTLRLFGKALGIPLRIQTRMQRRFDQILQADFADFSIARILQDYEGRLLLLHDEGDRRVPFSGFETIRAALPRQQYVATCGLGHRRILEDAEVHAHIRRVLQEEAVSEFGTEAKKTANASHSRFRRFQ